MRPDLTNYIKLGEDALTGVVFRDDSLVCEQRTAKVYSATPRLLITVEAL